MKTNKKITNFDGSSVNNIIGKFDAKDGEQYESIGKTYDMKAGQRRLRRLERNTRRILHHTFWLP